MNNNDPKPGSVPLVDPSVYELVTEAVRAAAKQALEAGTVAAVVGYAAGRRDGTALPVIIGDPAETSRLIFSPACVNNLSFYLTKAKKEVSGRGKLAIIAKGCDMRALIGLISESQLTRGDVFIIGVACPGVLRSGAGCRVLTGESIADKCRECTVHLPEGADVQAGTLPPLPKLDPVEAEELARLEAMTPAERWDFWKQHFSRCVRCLACRQVCPFCYCEQCLCDRNRPQAVESTPRPGGNMAWHLVRAIHLAGRCGGCAECERVCPMDIPLNLLNRKMAKELKELYDFEAGLEAREKGPLTSYDDKDDQSFIK